MRHWNCLIKPVHFIFLSTSLLIQPIVVVILVWIHNNLILKYFIEFTFYKYLEIVRKKAIKFGTHVRIIWMFWRKKRSLLCEKDKKEEETRLKLKQSINSRRKINRERSFYWLIGVVCSLETDDTKAVNNIVNWCAKVFEIFVEGKIKSTICDKKTLYKTKREKKHSIKSTIIKCAW